MPKGRPDSGLTLTRQIPNSPVSGQKRLPMHIDCPFLTQPCPSVCVVGFNKCKLLYPRCPVPTLPSRNEPPRAEEDEAEDHNYTNGFLAKAVL